MPTRMILLAGCVLCLLAVTGCGRGPDGGASRSGTSPSAPADRFLSLMNQGRNLLDQGEATNALAVYRQAEAIRPDDADLRLNLAIAHLQAGAPAQTLREAGLALELEPDSAAAWFLTGTAHLRLSDPRAAVQALENARKIDPGDSATSFQLGRAHMALAQWEEAVSAFRAGIAADPNRLHTAAHNLLAQSLLRAGREAEAQEQLQNHPAGSDAGGAPGGLAAVERGKHTRARVPFRLDQPDASGLPVRFVDATATAFGPDSDSFAGPVGVIDLDRAGANDLVVFEPGRGLRLLRNRQGTFRPEGAPLPLPPATRPARVLVGDLDNDRAADLVLPGTPGTQVFQSATNRPPADVSTPSGLATVPARDGLLMDLDFTGKLDLVAVETDGRLRVFRQSGPLTFQDVTATSGIPSTPGGVQAVRMEDWNRDGLMDLIASREAGPPLLLEKRRGGPLVPREMTNWVAGTVFCTGDFDNDLRPDLAIAGPDRVTLCFNGGTRSEIVFTGTAGFRQLVAVDHDNDGWLDLWGAGDTIRAWRNRGLAGFEEQTTPLGLAGPAADPVAALHFADFDGDCDPDVVVATARGGLRLLRNDGGNANRLVKVQLSGNRSNASGLGCKVEIASGGLRLLRTVHELPVEIGVGRSEQLDSFLVHWANWPQGEAGVRFDCHTPLLALELTIQEGSCPYLYAWDGRRFRFVTDILGSAPLGLPVAEGRYTDADPDEFVWIGHEDQFPPRDGHHLVSITEELREVLYLDTVELVVVDRDPDTEVHPTDKLLPAGPFPPGELVTLHRAHPLLRAETLEGQDVTAALQAVDGNRVSPPRLRAPQLRGLAEPNGVILDFAPLDIARPLVLVLNGWIRFGGGMANIAASHDPALPFPFPTLEAETASGAWRPVDVTVGAPSGKTKTILVDLTGRLEPGSRRLRLRQAFEIHWDRIALLEKQPDAPTRLTRVPPALADLRFRGFSDLLPLPPDCPLTPDYDAVRPAGRWTVIPGGWCTRYGDVLELLARRDEGLVLMNAGDELLLAFPANALPPRPAGRVREFFLYADGWDKDSDFHVATGTTVEPLPFHGQRDQDYGRQQRPPFPSDALHLKYNTRWVDSRALWQATRR